MFVQKEDFMDTLYIFCTYDNILHTRKWMESLMKVTKQANKNYIIFQLKEAYTTTTVTSVAKRGYNDLSRLLPSHIFVGLN